MKSKENGFLIILGESTRRKLTRGENFKKITTRRDRFLLLFFFSSSKKGNDRLRRTESQMGETQDYCEAGPVQSLHVRWIAFVVVRYQVL